MSRRREKLRGEWPQGARDLGEEVGGGSSDDSGAGTGGGGGGRGGSRGVSRGVSTVGVCSAGDAGDEEEGGLEHHGFISIGFLFCFLIFGCCCWLLGGFLLKTES